MAGTEGEVRITDDHDTIRRLALEAGLEDGTFENIDRAYGYFVGDEMAGTVAVKRVGDVFSAEWLSVRSDLRGQGIGATLVRKAVEHAKERGAKRLWALARAPDFFLRIGFSLSAPEDSPGPTFAGCSKCNQYNRSCFPKIVVLDLE